jgi:hypothetical protein
MMIRLLTLLTLLSCSHHQLQEAQSEKEIPYRSLASEWKADIRYVGFSADDIKKVQGAVKMIKKIIASDEFRELVINYRFLDKKQFHENSGYSNEEIYQLILLGSETTGNRLANNTMNVELELYEDNSKTIGYTYPHTTKIWMNRKYFHKYTKAQVAGNLMHEWLHKLGFTHAVKWDKDREHSVPYAIGYLIEDLAIKFEL